MRDDFLAVSVPRPAVRHRDGRLEAVALELIPPGDRLLIRRGDVVPLDGAVTESVAVLDRPALTNESLPVQLRAGGLVLSGSTNAGDAFDLTATHPAARSTYAGVIRLVEAAAAFRHLPPVEAALLQEAIDVAVIFNALRG